MAQVRKLIVYSDYCMKCVNRAKWQELRAFAEKHHLLLEDRRTKYDKKYLKEAQQYSDLLPIIVLGDLHVELGEPLEHLL
jgi:hypothetical protein